MNADGTNQVRITNNAATDANPTWSPDGSKIAFYTNRDAGNYEIYSMNADGTNPTRLTNNVAFDYQPAWSPDGRKIAFVSTRDGNYEIYTMNSDGSNQQNITKDPGFDGTPAWSPDGTKIAFSSFRTGNYEIFTMNADGTNQTQITNNAATDTDPTWSPDGSRICFASYRDGNGTLYSVSAYGGTPTPLTGVESASCDGPNWSPFLARTPKTLVGVGGSLGTAAAGFLFGQKDLAVKSILAFDTSTVASRSGARVVNQTANETQGTNLIFSITTSAGLASVTYAPINDAGVPDTAVSPPIPASSTAALVSFSSSQGIVTSVIPYTANRSVNEKPKASGDNLTYNGSFTAIYDAKGNNVAPNGASSVTLNAKTGELVSCLKN